MKIFIMRIEVPDYFTLESLIDCFKWMIEKVGAKKMKISRIWEPQEERICKCGKFSLHVRWDPEKGERYLCCECWVTEGNAPAEHHARLKKKYLSADEIIELAFDWIQYDYGTDHPCIVFSEFEEKVREAMDASL